MDDHYRASDDKNIELGWGTGLFLPPNGRLASLTCSIDAGEEMLHHLITLLFTFVDICPGTDSGSIGEGMRVASG